MNFFEGLGRRVDELWRKADFADTAFADTAARAMTEMRPSDNVDPIDIIRWVHSPSSRVRQSNIYARFGDPPITVFSTERFHIDALFWVDGTTTIHQHGFSGAFHVLTGSSIECLYEFVEHHRFNERLLLGKLEPQRADVLRRGDVRPIYAGSRLIHSLFHLDRPSVSVVVRTPSDVTVPQYAYARCGIAHDPFFLPESIFVKRESVSLLQRVADPRFESFARETVRNSDSLTAFVIVSALLMGFSSHREARQFVESLAPAHPLLIGPLLELEYDTRRTTNIIMRRRLVQHPDQRFFLALLLNLPSRAPIMELVSRAYPQRDPRDTVHEWLLALGGAGDVVSAATPLGVRLDDSACAIARCLLDDLGGGALLAKLREVYDVEPGDEAQVIEMSNAFRDSLMFAPLFRSP